MVVEGAGDVQGQQDEDRQHAGAVHRGHRPDAAEPRKRAGERHQENDGVEGEMDSPGGEAQGRVFGFGRRRGAAPEAQGDAQQGEQEDGDAARDMEIGQQELGLRCRRTALGCPVSVVRLNGPIGLVS